MLALQPSSLYTRSHLSRHILDRPWHAFSVTSSAQRALGCLDSHAEPVDSQALSIKNQCCNLQPMAVIELLYMLVLGL